MTQTVQKTESVPKKKGSAGCLVIALVLIALNVLVVMLYKPIKPHIFVASESLLFNINHGILEPTPWFTLPLIGPVYLTNTLVPLLVVFIALFAMAVAIRRQTHAGNLKPRGFVLLLELIISALLNIAGPSVDKKWQKKVFPLYITIFLFVATANLTKLLPIYETIGWAVPVPADGLIVEGQPIHGLRAEKWTSWLYALTADTVDSHTTLDAQPDLNAAHVVDTALSEAHADDSGYMLIPLLRGSPTDLNFTTAIAIVAVVMVQVIGVQAQGFAYFNKYINIRAIKRSKMGIIDFIVGLLDIVLEIAKILSFSFRLFGNMFAGMILLLFITYMVPWVANSGLILYETFIGLLQGFVFAMLTAVFMGMAVVSHDGH